uniref:Uncharacterized protein n=1 Tax=Panagrolaimus davidi TaxID=227884 RepID=A0A914QBH8_9BILA
MDQSLASDQSMPKKIPKYITKYPPIYQGALKELEKWACYMKERWNDSDWNDDCEDDDETDEFLEEFTKKFWLPPFYAEKFNYSESKRGIAVIPMDFEKYEMYVFWDDSVSEEDTCKNGEISLINDVLTYLEIPCDGLEKIIKIATVYSAKPLSKVMIEKCKNGIRLRNELRRNWWNLEKWYKTLKKFDDKDLIIANFEHRLSKMNESADIRLWKYYIDFLKKYDLKKMLKVYKCCIRIFIKNKELVKEYQKEIENAAKLSINVGKFFSDTIKWEEQFGNKESLKPFIEKVVSIVTKKPFISTKRGFKKLLSGCGRQINQIETCQEKLQKSKSFFDGLSAKRNLLIAKRTKKRQEKRCLYPNFENFAKQNFNFSGPIIRYISKNASSAVLQKLYESCKYFYAKSKIPLCYRLLISTYKTKYYQQSLQFSIKDINVPKFEKLLQNIKIVNCLQFDNYDDINSETFSTLIRKLNIASVKYISISAGDFKMDDLKYLLKNCLELKMLDCGNVDFYDSLCKKMKEKMVKNVVKKSRPNLLFIQ